VRIFLIKLLFFSLPIILLAYPLDIFLSKGLQMNNEYAAGEFAVWNDIYQGSITADLVIYGNSRAWRHYDPEIIKKKLGYSAYNMGIDGQNFRLQNFRHEAYLKNNTKPKVIIISYDVYTFIKHDGIYNKQQFLPYMLFNKTMYHHTRSYHEFTWFDFNIPLMRYRFETGAMFKALKHYFKEEKQIGARKAGFQGLEKDWDKSVTEKIDKIENYRIVIDSSLIPIFKDFTNSCKKQRIQVLLVNSPEYNKTLDAIDNRKEVRSFIRSLAREENLDFIDFNMHPIGDSISYFYNSGHLNARGAERFSEVLCDSLRNHGVINQSIR
jgi:hypothetical protein